MSKFTLLSAGLAVCALACVGAASAQPDPSRLVSPRLAPYLVAFSDAGRETAAGYSTSAAETAAADSRIMSVAQPAAPQQAQAELPLRPFSRIAIGTRTGTLGVGLQIATPLARRVNLRGGFDMFSYDYSLSNDGTNYGASLRMKSGVVSADVYPFPHSSFHLSPGLLIFKSGVSATMLVPGGNTFTENDTDYTSDPTDPVNGSGVVQFTRSVMPMFTFGFGNMITRRETKHWSVPIELGAAYTGHYTLAYSLAGSVCSPDGCGSVNDPSVQGNVQQEQNKIDEELKHFQLYPIVTVGLAYRF